MSEPNPPILEARELSKTYLMGGTPLDVLRGVDMQVHEGEVLAIVGSSGAGKSTLLHLLGLLDRPTSGDVRFRGRSVGAARAGERARIRLRHIGFVFQFYHLIHELSALENVLLSRMMDRSMLEWWGTRKQERERALEALVGLGLGDRLDHRPSQLSGGERQRVAIARAMVSDPDVLLCDEPTGNLDERTAAEIVEVLFQLRERTGKTMVLVTHDLELAARADRSLTLHAGRIAEDAASSPRLST